MNNSYPLEEDIIASSVMFFFFLSVPVAMVIDCRLEYGGVKDDFF